MVRRARATASSLRIRDFLALVEDGLRTRLGADLGGMESRQRFGYVQLYRDDPSVHYEVWAQRKTGRVEIGLHFEGADRERNYAAAELLAAHQPEVMAAIGPEFELEEWTAQWTRLHQSIDALALTAAIAEEAAGRAAALITGMEPLVEMLGLRSDGANALPQAKTRAPRGARARQAAPLHRPKAQPARGSR